MNLGCALRVSTQIMTDWHPGAFALIGVSGTLEVAGLAWWGLGLLRIMFGVGAPASAEPGPGSERPVRIEPGHIVADVLGWFPETGPVFDRHGFTALRQPMLRRMLAHQVTLAQAARLNGVRADLLVEDLNAAIETRPGPDQTTPSRGLAGARS
jgi:hypothetical protein